MIIPKATIKVPPNVVLRIMKVLSCVDHQYTLWVLAEAWQEDISMRLREWMDKTNTDVLKFAELTGSSVHTVKKWLKNREKDGRTPRPAMQTKIRNVTKGDVMPNDWVA